MKIHRKIAAAFLAVAVAAGSYAIPAYAKGSFNFKSEVKTLKGDYASGEVLVTLKPDAGSQYLDKSRAKTLYGEGITIKDTYTMSSGSGDKNKLRIVLLKSKTLSTSQLKEKLSANSAVSNVSPNYRKKICSVTDDAHSKFQWALKNEGQYGGTAGEDINVSKLWDEETKAESEQVVAVIDTGIDLKHEDLQDCLWTNTLSRKELIGKHGLDFTGTIDDMSPMDDNGHGTHVSGIIAAAADNQKGISGISPTNTKIMALKGLDEDGYGYDSGLCSAFEYVYRAKKLGVNVCAINCSWSGYADESDVKMYDCAINKLGELGVITCVSAGNDGYDIDEVDEDGYREYSTPTSCTSPYCITVAATNQYGKLEAFSTYGKETVDVAAPGTTILSTVSYNSFNPTLYTDEQREKLCADYQSYDDDFGEGDFGVPEVHPVIESYKTTDKISVSQSDEFFGTSGKSLKISFDEKPKNETVAVLTVPFELEEENQPYSYSFDVKTAAKDAGFIAIDTPADVDMEEVLDSIFDLYLMDRCWYHYWERITIPEEKKKSDDDEEDEDDIYTGGYKKAKQRQLVFVIVSNKDIFIDDLAISRQGDIEDEFGKYDYMDGTSQATPYVTGAVALLRNKHPELNTLDTVNTIINTGKESAALKNKIKSGKILSLDNIDNLPPMITSVEYNADGNVEIKGSLYNTTAVNVNGSLVYPLKKVDGSVIIPDDSYSLKSTEFEVKNKYGSDKKKVILTKRKLFESSKLVRGEPNYPNDGDFLPAGNRAYFVEKSYNTIGVLEESKKGYTYSDKYNLKFKSIFGKKNNVEIISSAYSDNKIYMLVMNKISGDKTYIPFAYETRFCYYDLKTKKLTSVCELPDDIMSGASLVYYNKGFYIIGGYDVFNASYLDSVYKYNTKKNAFTKMKEKLPQARAYSRYVVCDGKIVGVYGAQEDKKLPQIITYDGKTWKTSSVKLESDNYYQYGRETQPAIYSGSVGYEKNGVFCNGAFIDGVGTAFVYNVKKDQMTPFEGTFSIEKSNTNIYGTTLPNCFIGFTATNGYDDYDDYEYYDDSKSTKAKDEKESEKESEKDDKLFDDDDDSSTGNVYVIKLKNNQAVTEITLNKTKLTMYVGKTAAIKATVAHGKGKTTYKSSKKSVVTVSKKGKLKALKAGKAVITVTNNKVKAKVTVTVKKSKTKKKASTKKSNDKTVIIK